MQQVQHIFDRRLVRQHRTRSAALLHNHDFLIREAAERLCDRFGEEIERSFPIALDLGARQGQLSELLKQKAGVEYLVRGESASFPPAPDVVLDDERPPFAAGSFDLVASCLNLHWVNDLPGCFRRIHGILKPGGLFLASMLGGETLRELRTALTMAESALSGGASPRISPFTLVKDAGRLLHHAGFGEPVASAESITVLYPDIHVLLRDLRAMGETSALLERNRAMPPRLLMQAAGHIYKEQFGDAEGNIPATFEIITLTGWKN